MDFPEAEGHRDGEVRRKFDRPRQQYTISDSHQTSPEHRSVSSSELTTGLVQARRHSISSVSVGNMELRASHSSSNVTPSQTYYYQKRRSVDLIKLPPINQTQHKLTRTNSMDGAGQRWLTHGTSGGWGSSMGGAGVIEGAARPRKGSQKSSKSGHSRASSVESASECSPDLTTSDDVFEPPQQPLLKDRSPVPPTLSVGQNLRSHSVYVSPPDEKKTRRQGRRGSTGGGAEETEETGHESRRNSGGKLFWTSSTSFTGERHHEELSDNLEEAQDESELPLPLPATLEPLYEVPSPSPTPSYANQDLIPHHRTVSPPGVEESTPTPSCMGPAQETIEGAGMYDPRINRLPDTHREEAEDRELREFSDLINKANMIILKDNMERVQRQYTKVIERYRRQCEELKEEHEAEKAHLERQVDLEKTRSREGAAIQRLMKFKLEENRAEMKGQACKLQDLHKEYQEKKDEVAELRRRLDEKEEELKTVRTNYTRQHRTMSELVPLPLSHAHEQYLSSLREMQLQLESLLKLMPEEKQIREIMDRRRRLLQNRPATTGMIQKTSKKKKGEGKHPQPSPPATSNSSNSSNSSVVLPAAACNPGPEHPDH